MVPLPNPGRREYGEFGGNEMQSASQRAIIIGLMGPAVQALGFIWTALHLLFAHWADSFGPRHMMYEPGILLIVVGFLLSLLCVPVALEVARASEEDVEIPVYQPETSDQDGSGGGRLGPAHGRLARYSAGRTHPATGQDQPTRSPG